MTKPELLAPAGDFEKLKAAVNFGADAVYLGAQAFSLRAGAKNFNGEELGRAIEYSHKHGVKVYVAANIFARNSDFDGLSEFFKTLNSLAVDAVIISDPGFFDAAREVAPGLNIHISTQANTINYGGAAFWHKLGAKRVILARELSFCEISEIKQKVPGLELEMFVHGAMCVSYSGRCLLSNYLTGRDANRGECAHPCRYEYHLVEEKRQGEFMPVYEDERGTYVFNSKDLCLIERLPQVISTGVSSLKIEGRTKTPHYVASVTKAYRQAIDDFFADEEKYLSRRAFYMAELEKSSHRPYTTGFCIGNNDKTIYHRDSKYIRTHDFAGVVLDYDPDTGIATIEQRSKFSVGQTIEFLRSGEENFTQRISEMRDENGNTVDSAPHAKQKIKIKTDLPVKAMDIMRVGVG